MKNIAVFCTADDAYVSPSIVALQSIRRFHGDCSYFIIASRDRISEENIALASAFGIELIHFDEDHLFTNAHHWPKESFWKLKGPEIFWQLGFSHSLGIDGDILCVQPLTFPDLLPQIDGYAGIENRAPRSGNFEQPDLIQRKYDLSEEDLGGHNANTGVILWNNQTAVESRLFERAARCYQECTAHNPRMFIAGDQSLFALVSILQPALPWLILDSGYNYRMHRDDVRQEDLAEEDIRIYHFTLQKPWRRVSVKRWLLNPALLLHRDKWFAFVDAQGVFNRDLTLKSHHVIHRLGRTAPYLLDDWMTSVLIRSQVARRISPLTASIRMARRRLLSVDSPGS